MSSNSPPAIKLIFILGPTASGKTAHAIQLAQQLDTEIVSCDSRQFYSELDIGVARPSADELAAVPHHFIACRSVSNPYNVSTYEHEAIDCINRLFQTHEHVIAVGGSGLYIEALCNGIAILPDPDPALREELQQKLRNEGVESLRTMLRTIDPIYYQQVDLANGVRIQRALEVSLTVGRPYSEVIRQPRKTRSFQVETVVIDRRREELRQRIDSRVDMMMSQGLEDEARRLYPLRHINTLNTVGYKEFFTLWDTIGNTVPLNAPQRTQVADAIRLNTWHYAKKQLTWLKKYVPCLGNNLCSTGDIPNMEK